MKVDHSEHCNNHSKKIQIQIKLSTIYENNTQLLAANYHDLIKMRLISIWNFKSKFKSNIELTFATQLTQNQTYSILSQYM